MSEVPAIDETMKKRFGKVGVLMGGWAAERSVSLKSGQAVLEGLLEKGIDAHKIDVDRNIIDVVRDGKFDRLFNILHGRGGEDGVIQGALEILQIPYTGCGVMASAISMDKLMTKRIWTGSGLPTPAFEILDSESNFEAVVEKLGLPVIVKPAQEGSSIGMSKVNDAKDLKAAYEKAAEFDDVVFAEQWVTGQEYTIAILEEALKSLSKTAFDIVGGRGWGRVDVMQDNVGTFWLIEVNTSPGMTDHSLVPMAAKQHGLSFSDLTLEILKLSGLEKKIESNPWVHSASMTHVWPDKLTVRIYEQQPVAYWGEKAMLAENGQIIKAVLAEKSNDLPLLYSPENKGRNMASGFLKIRKMMKGFPVKAG
ncbi:D-alanine--D-alanine ligase [Nymphon striatum]|nr:D-alanine--D-alanine ligase [Nymphon striatum]